MKLILLLMTAFMHFGNQNKESKVQSTDIVGRYKVYKTELAEDYSNGWNYSRRYERTLTLYPDSTYDEVNLSFEAFDHIDEFGRWNIKDAQIVLIPQGELEYVNGQHIRVKYHNAKNIKRYLDIANQEELRILDQGFLKNEKLIKQVRTENKVH